MVYFGKKTFSNPRRSTPNDKLPLIILAAVGSFVGLILYLANTVAKNDDLAKTIPPQLESEVPAAASELPPLPRPEPSVNFNPDASVLRGGVSAMADPDQIDYLFQRWLLDIEIPNNGVAPTAEEIKGRTQELLGRRFTIELRLADIPYSRTGLVENGGLSGVTHYYEAWGVDYNESMHRIVFAEKNEVLEGSSHIVADVDFLQIYEYAMAPNEDNKFQDTGRVPMWVARTVKPSPTMHLVAGNGWSPFFWVGGIMLIGAIILGVVVLSQRVQAPRQRVFKMGSSS